MRYRNRQTESLKKLIRKSQKYIDWRTQVFGRDSFTCQDCNARGVWLGAHHQKSFSVIIEENDVKILDDAMKCNELWDLNNGITLCELCHKRKHSTMYVEVD